MKTSDNTTIKVTGINIKVKGQSLALTVEEAWELKRELDGLLEVKMYQPWVPYHVHHIHHYPLPTFTRPYEITCGGLGNGIAGFNTMERLT